jgi:DNA primase small subunit
MVMNPATTEFLRQRFTEYYRKAFLTMPSSLEQREFAFIYFNPDTTDKWMSRHKDCFGIRDEVESRIRTLVPAHVYYSTAYYKWPGGGTMTDKGWLGADLIFDLDADHIVRGPYDQMLARVKEETEKLLDMLSDEFGISKKNIELVFSGGRGYHVHVKEIEFRTWDSAERRELIDYVCGIGISPISMLSNNKTSTPGWPKRYQDSLLEYLDWLKKQEPKKAMEHLLSHDGIGETTAHRFLNELTELIGQLKNQPREMVFKNSQNEIRIKNDALKILLTDQNTEFKNRLLAKAALADEPVTTDIKRLIRMPTSLHGGSGMRVQPLEFRELHDFNPLVDAVVFGTRDINVNATFSLKMPMLGSTYEIQKGINKLPEAIAVFLCARGAAEIA